VVEQWTQVDPSASLLQHLVDGLDELDNVVSTVDEEACDDTVLAGDILWTGVHIKEVTSCHGELGILCNVIGCHKQYLVLIG